MNSKVLRNVAVVHTVINQQSIHATQKILMEAV